MTGILLFGFIFQCIDFRIRIDIRSNQTQHQNVNQKVNAKDLIIMFDKLTGFYDKMIGLYDRPIKSPTDGGCAESA